METVGHRIRLPSDATNGPVNIWLAGTEQSELWLAHQNLLSPREKNVWYRYRDDTARNNYLISRIMLHFILAGLKDSASSDLKFGRGKFGKPFIKRCSAGFSYMNLSHCSGIVAIAFCQSRQLGIDIEPIDRECISSGLLQHSMAQSEQNIITNTPVSQRNRRFIEYWTLKESFLKATGYGLSRSPRTVIFDIETLKSSRFVSFEGDHSISEYWQFLQLCIIQKYILALCVNRGNESLKVNVQELLPSLKTRPSSISIQQCF